MRACGTTFLLFRDRDILDVTLVGALKDFLRPRTVTIFRCVCNVGNERWITRARLGEDDAQDIFNGYFDIREEHEKEDDYEDDDAGPAQGPIKKKGKDQ